MKLKELPKAPIQIQRDNLLAEVEQLRTALIQKDNTIQSLQNQLTTQTNTAIKNSEELAIQKQTLNSKILECDSVNKTINAKDLIISEKQNIINTLQDQLSAQTQLIQDYNTQLSQAKTDLSNKDAYIKIIVENDQLKIENLRQQEKIKTYSSDTLNYDLYLYQDLRIKELEEQVEKLTITIYPQNRNSTPPPTNRPHVELDGYTFDDFKEKQKFKLDADIQSIEKEFQTKMLSFKAHHSSSDPSFTPIELTNRLAKSELQKFNIAPKIKGLCEKIEHSSDDYEHTMKNLDTENLYIKLIGNSDDDN